MKSLTNVMKTVAMAAVVAAGASAHGQVNQLLNADFETVCTPALGWTKFGNVDSINFYTTSGARSIKMFGTFCGPGPCYSGIYQDAPATPGSQWQANANVLSPCWDRLRPIAGGGTQARVAIDFFDANGVQISAPGEWVSPPQSESTVAGGNTTCGLGEPYPEPLAVNLLTTVATAPAGTATVRVTMLVEQTQFVGGAAWFDDASLVQVDGANTNVLTNPSFEDAVPGCGGSSLANWTNFGNGQANEGENARGGLYAAKLFGGYNGNPAFSGWFQNVPATPGTRWKARGWARSSSTDSLAVGNDVFLAIEFFDAFGTNLIGAVGRSTGVPTPGDDTYRQYTTGYGTAPLGTAFARCLMLQVQPNFLGGATWWDDMEFYTTNCVADYDNGSGEGLPDGGVGIEDLLYYLSVYDLGSVEADTDDGSGTGITDGGVGIEDLLYYLGRYDAGC